MKLQIDRARFWFNDDDNIAVLCNRYTFLGILLSRLLNEKYIGKKINYLNLTFHINDERLIKAYGENYYLHFYGGSFMYKKVIDFNHFLALNFQEQKLFIWKEGYDMLQFAGKELKNESLLISSEYAYHKGLEMRLNADYRIIEADIILFEENYKASLWVNFLEDKMQATFTLEKDNKIVLEKFIDDGPNGMEFFLVMFKKIEQNNSSSIVIKGLKDVRYLPLKINFTKEKGKIVVED